MKTFTQSNSGSSQQHDFLSNFIDACTSVLDEELLEDIFYFHIFKSLDVYYCCLGDDAALNDQKV